MDGLIAVHSQAENARILDAVAAGNAQAARDLLSAHVYGRVEQITEAIREGYAIIYLDQSGQGTG